MWDELLFTVILFRPEFDSSKSRSTLSGGGVFRGVMLQDIVHLGVRDEPSRASYSRYSIAIFVNECVCVLCVSFNSVASLLLCVLSFSHYHHGVAGYDLLKKKSDALTFRFRDVTRKIRDAKDEMGEVARAASFSLSEAVWAAGDFKCVLGVAIVHCPRKPPHT
jgi:hypothetical protein